MSRASTVLSFVGTVAAGCAAFLLLRGADAGGPPDRIWQHRNLGKAFYENPTTQVQAVDEFKKALDMAPDSARERLNYGLALLRAGKTKEGVAEIEKAQKQDPKIPHTWFNLGVQYKKDSEYDKAIQQFEQMSRLQPEEPATHYNLGVLYKLGGKADAAMRRFETASKLDPNLAGPHFQLYNAYRSANRPSDAARELKEFQEIKKRQAGAAIPEDLEWSFFAEIYETLDPANSKEDSTTGPEVKWSEKKLADGLNAPTAGASVLDADGDGRPDAVVWSASGIQVFKGGSVKSENPALAAVKDVISVTAADFNNDGLADLTVLSKTGVTLFANQKGVFQKNAAQPPAGVYARAVWIDHDHDYDLDLFLLGAKCALVRNNGAAGFSDQTADFPFAKGNATSGVLFELISDTNGSDLVVGYEDRQAVLYRDKLAGKFEAMPLDAIPAGTISLAAQDVDNDGWMDLAAGSPSGMTLAFNREGKLLAGASPASARGPVTFVDLENRGIADLVSVNGISRNLGAGAFAPAKALKQAGSAFAAADFDADGRADLLMAGADGSVSLLRNETETKNGWIRIALTGVKNVKLAPGAEVEVKAGARYQKKVYEGIPLVFGLRGHKQADTVRITWPNGLIQNEPKQAAGKAFAYKEAQRLSGSCPMIFTWNGKEFEFITDVLGVAPLGASSGDGEYFPVDHDEYVQIPGESLKLENGRYEIRITEELREVSYLDQIKLIAVDHPADTEIYTNDKFKSPPFPEFRLYGVQKRFDSTAARDHNGMDVRARLSKRDRVYADGFKRDFSGVAELHHVDLDFKGRADGNKAVLILNGWVDWADGSTFLGASQESKDGLVFPYLQVKDKAGQWQTVISDMGIPAGKPKTIAVDLTGKFLSDSREVRIVTNLCVYWDEIFLSEETGTPQTRITPLVAGTAGLRFRGFSKPVIHPERKQPESFVYANWMAGSMWNPTPGYYTRYGDVAELLNLVDDRMVLMGSGDELRLSYSADELPAVSSGWKRDFLLYVDGWAKDGDANTAYSQTVEPLPFHAMAGYPYKGGERFPQTGYQKEFNTRPALRLLRPLAERRK